MTEQIKRVITLSDDPASTDAFGRAHDRVAEAIADVIKTDPKVGGKMIGLEGDWGGGKSTVVELLEKRFADDDNTRFFLYDAWAHQGNTLRRNFIDSLSKEIEQPRPKPWVSVAPISGIDSRTKWEKERDELANRSSTTTTRIYPKGTVFGKLMALWIVFITVAIPLLVVGFDRHYDADPATSGMAHFTLSAFLLVIYPLAVVVSRAIYLWWKQLPFTGEGSWSWLVGDAVKESESTTSMTPDSTSIEFEALFDKLLREALDGENSRKLIIVIDNLDRISRDHALDIWATLQTFVRQRRETHETAYRKRIFFIVPYSPEGIQRIWPDKTNDKTSQQSNETIHENAAQSFIEKSFILRFEVPPPVHSEWRQYLKDCLDRALGGVSEPEQREGAIRAFDLWRANDKIHPTPRELKLLVNQIGTLYRQWPTGPALSSMTYYSLLRRRGDDVLARLKGDGSGETVPHSDFTRLFGDSLKNDLADLAFNVGNGKGMQLLLEDPIADALLGGEHEKLCELEERHGAGFWSVLTTVSDRRVSLAEYDQCAKAAQSVEATEWVIDEKDDALRRLIDAIDRRLASFDRMPVLSAEVTEGLASLLRLQRTQSTATRILQHLRTTLDGESSSDENRDVPATIKAVMPIIQSLVDCGFEALLSEPVYLGLTAGHWVAACEALKGLDIERLWRFLRPATDMGAEEIEVPIAAAMESGTIGDSQRACIEITSSIMPHSWEKVCANAEARLQASQENNVPQVLAVLNTLLDLRLQGNENSVAAIRALANNGDLLHWLHQANSAKNQQAELRLLFAQLACNPTLKIPAPVGESASGRARVEEMFATDDDGLIEGFLAIIREQGDESMLLGVRDSTAPQPLVTGTIRRVCSSDSYDRLVTPGVFVERRNDLKADLPQDEFDSLLERLVLEKGLCEHIQSAPEGFVIDDADLYRHILENVKAPDNGKSSLSAFIGWCNSEIRGLKDEEWAEQLRSGGDIYPILVWLGKQGTPVDLQHSYDDALVKVGYVLAVGNWTATDFAKKHGPSWLGLITDETRRTNVGRRLLKTALDIPEERQIPAGFFEVFGDAIATDSVLADDPKLTQDLFIRIVREPNPASIDWLEGVLKNNPTIVSKFPEKGKAFRLRVTDARDAPGDNEEDRKATAERIATLIGLPKKKPADTDVDAKVVTGSAESMVEDEAEPVKREDEQES